MKVPSWPAENERCVVALAPGASLAFRNLTSVLHLLLADENGFSSASAGSSFSNWYPSGMSTSSSSALASSADVRLTVPDGVLVTAGATVGADVLAAGVEGAALLSSPPPQAVSDRLRTAARASGNLTKLGMDPSKTCFKGRTVSRSVEALPKVLRTPDTRSVEPWQGQSKP